MRVEDHELYGRCETCKNYGRLIICCDCNEGSGYEFDTSIKMYEDNEWGEILTEDELKKEYYQLKRSGDTEAETYEDYVRNCTDKNGTLTRIN